MAVTHFAGTFLVLGAVVVALNWGHSIPVETGPAVAERDRAETVHLFSAAGPRAAAIPPQPALSPWPDVKLPVKKSTSVQGTSTTFAPPKARTVGKVPKQQPNVVSQSGHIL
jgi:hypothetical protein